MVRKRGAPGPRDPAAEAVQKALIFLHGHPLFSPLLRHVHVDRTEGNRCPRDGWAVVTVNGVLHAHPKRRATSEEWIWVFAHCLLHLGFGHFQKRARQDLWNLACDAFVNRFLEDLKLGRRPVDVHAPSSLTAQNENALYDHFFERGVPPEMRGDGTAGPEKADMDFSIRPYVFSRDVEWERLLGEGLRAAVAGAVDVAAGVATSLSSGRKASTAVTAARSWFMANYPLLGSLAAAFDLIEDANLAKSLEISVAAVDAEAREIYFNPRAGLDYEECRFVMAHELLHVGLRHQARCQGRDPWYWNVACDFVINGWLIEMGVGRPPRLGLLHDPDLKGLSAEAVYDLIVRDLRKYRKLATFRGTNQPDMLPGRRPGWWEMGEGVTLDDFYRRCLTQGLLWHQDQGRGLLPAGLIEEIRALDQPPIPWDVELAQWFDHYFPPRERRRSYARPSRRQMATPDIPRPRYVPIEEDVLRTFAVVLDTSGSMDRKLLAKGLGAITSYSLAREVDAVRLVFCDAAPYDQGFVRPEEIAERVKVKGRGGTVLQPGLDLLDKDPAFPKTGPVLIITDGYCDVLRVRREHAFLMPAGSILPFSAQGPVFRIR